MKMLAHRELGEDEEMFLVPQAQAPLALPAVLGPEASELLQRMFRDPRVLEPHERGDLIAQLRQSVRTGASGARGQSAAGHGALRRPAGAGSDGRDARSSEAGAGLLYRAVSNSANC